jgi:ABC-type amino acid transport substrate-binding protein
MKARIRTTSTFLFLSLLSIAVLVPVIGIESALAGTIDKMRENQALRIAYREDAPPFSYKEANSTEPTGYMLHLCQSVTKKLADQLDIPTLKISYVSVTAANRFEAIEKHDADLLCEATSATLSRRRKVDFSIATFADGAGLLTNDPKLENLTDFAGKKIGVLAGTTTEEALRNTLKDANIQAEVVPAKTHDDGLAMLDGDKISAYFGDRSILMFLVQRSKAPDRLFIAQDYFTVEPYALALAHGDEDFRLAVDTALSHIYRSGEISKIFEQTFAGKIQPSDMIKALYRLSGLPD